MGIKIILKIKSSVYLKHASVFSTDMMYIKRAIRTLGENI